MVKVSTFEKQFVEKICFLENNIKHNQDEIRKRDMVILDLKEQVESAKCRSDLQPQIEEISNGTLMTMTLDIELTIGLSAAMAIHSTRIRRVEQQRLYLYIRKAVESSTLLIHQPDSECSTTEAEASEKKVAEQFRVIPANAAHMS
ncbi:hypothetical protein ACLOJK_021042 [Asimina triloba]